MPVLVRRHWKLAIVWALSLCVVCALSLSAQVQRQGGGPLPDLPTITVSPTIISGNDVGFRIERTEAGIPTGRLVIRVDGRWIDTGIAAPALGVR